MKIKIAKNIWIFFSVVFFIITVASGAFAAGSWTCGKLIFDSEFPEELLLETMDGARGLQSLDFVERVGGIAFEAEATLGTNLEGNKVSLSYNSEQLDGNRLAVTVGNKIYTTNIPDWQLIPIANYADSSHTACVSLFGSKPPNEPKSSYHIIYHPAFNNTLLGLRLMQADMLFQSSDTWQQLPKFSGEIIRGQGESLTTLDLNADQHFSNAASEIVQTLHGKDVDSWVLTDYGLNVSILPEGDELSFSNRPYYYFWKSEGSRVVPVSNLTDEIRSKLLAVEQLNPSVFNAATQTMHFAALFRYIKRTNPTAWRSFLNQVATLDPEPHVQTPTRWLNPPTPSPSS